jgi:signal transduction histidine kinase
MRDFLLVAAHDLRAPLSSIRAAGELVASPRLPAAEVVDLGEVIMRQADNLAALIAELAELGRLEAGETRANPVDLLLGAMVAEAQEAAGPGGVEVSVEVDADLRVWADHGHVRRILMNYLTNAHHYAGSGVRLTARSAADSVEVCVADTGPGVPPEFVARLFDKFSRGTEARRAAGMGLGLAIVAALAKLNGGVAWYEPNTPTGAQFWVRLPAPP